MNENLWALRYDLLTPREIAVLGLRFYGEGLTLRQIGDKFNVTQERIRQVQAKAGRKLRMAAIKRNIPYGDSAQ